MLVDQSSVNCLCCWLRFVMTKAQECVWVNVNGRRTAHQPGCSGMSKWLLCFPSSPLSPTSHEYCSILQFCSLTQTFLATRHEARVGVRNNGYCRFKYRHWLYSLVSQHFIPMSTHISTQSSVVTPAPESSLRR